jgi:hypothetical protein
MHLALHSCPDPQAQVFANPRCIHTASRRRSNPSLDRGSSCSNLRQEPA